MSENYNIVYRKCYLVDITVGEPDDQDPDAEKFSMHIEVVAEAGKRKPRSRSIRSALDYTEKHFPGAVKVLFAHMLGLEGFVVSELRPNLRRLARNAIINTLNAADDAARRDRLSPDRAAEELPDYVSEEALVDFREEVLASMRRLSARGVKLLVRNVKIDLRFARLMKSVERGLFTGRERTENEVLIEEYNKDFRTGDTLLNPWRSLSIELKRHGVTFQEIKSKLT